MLHDLNRRFTVSPAELAQLSNNGVPAMNSYDEIQIRVLELTAADRGRLAVAVLDSLDDEPIDEQTLETWTQEVLSRSTAYSRGELQATDWREALQVLEADLDQVSAP